MNKTLIQAKRVHSKETRIMDKDKLKKLEDILSLLKDSVSQEEFQKFAKQLTDLVLLLETKVVQKVDKKLEDNLKDIKDLQRQFKDIIEKAKSDSTSTFGQIRQRAVQVVEDYLIKSGLKDILEDAKKIIQRVENLEMPEDGKTPTKEEFVTLIGEVLPPVIPETPEQTRDKLETLQGNDRISPSAIKGLEDEIKSLRKEIATKTSGGVRRVYQPYVERFTAQTDGATKTFYLKREPLRTDIIEITGTDFPIILDPTVDFTVSGKTITLAAGIPAPSSGATLIIKYYA
ncbi:MAG: hypothetical protein AAB706_01585 [Patescibacteria group bacterium]